MLNKKKFKIFFKFTAISLIHCFILMDFIWAGGSDVLIRDRNDQVSTLSPQMAITTDYFKIAYQELCGYKNPAIDFPKEKISKSPEIHNGFSRGELFRRAADSMIKAVLILGGTAAGLHIVKTNTFFQENIFVDNKFEPFAVLGLGVGLIGAAFIIRRIKGLLQSWFYSGFLKRLSLEESIVSEKLLEVWMDKHELKQAVKQVEHGWHSKKHDIITRKIAPLLKSLNIEHKDKENLETNIDRILDNALISVSRNGDYPDKNLVGIKVEKIIDKQKGKAYLSIYIIDKGQGVEREKLINIFAKHTKASKARKEYARHKLASYVNALYYSGKEIVEQMGGFIRVQVKNKTGSYELLYIGDNHRLKNLSGLLNGRGTKVQLCVPLKERVFVPERRAFIENTLFPILFLPIGMSLKRKDTKKDKETADGVQKNEEKEQSALDEKSLRLKMTAHLEKLEAVLWIFFKKGVSFDGIFFKIMEQGYWKNALKLKNDKEINMALEIYRKTVEEVLMYSNGEKFSDIFFYNYQEMAAIAVNIKGGDWKKLIDEFAEEARTVPAHPPAPDLGPLQKRKLSVEASPLITAAAAGIVPLVPAVSAVEKGPSSHNNRRPNQEQLKSRKDPEKEEFPGGNAFKVTISKRGKELSNIMHSKVLLEQAI